LINHPTHVQKLSSFMGSLERDRQSAMLERLDLPSPNGPNQKGDRLVNQATVRIDTQECKLVGDRPLFDLLHLDREIPRDFISLRESALGLSADRRARRRFFLGERMSCEIGDSRFDG
jgi:hypothetical protein